MYTLQSTRKFEKSIKKLPSKQKEKLPSTLCKLQDDPRQNSLYTKKNHTASHQFGEVIFESRIDSKYRILWKYEEDRIIILLVAGNHEVVEGKI